jgi:hypothetical protein
VVADQVRNGGVTAGDAAGDLGGLRVAEAGSAVGNRFLHLEEVVLPEQLDFRAGGLVGPVASGSGRAELQGDPVGGVQAARIAVSGAG